jgi:hypothetical protein
LQLPARQEALQEAPRSQSQAEEPGLTDGSPRRVLVQATRVTQFAVRSAGVTKTSRRSSSAAASAACIDV